MPAREELARTCLQGRSLAREPARIQARHVPAALELAHAVDGRDHEARVREELDLGLAAQQHEFPGLAAVAELRAIELDHGWADDAQIRRGGLALGEVVKRTFDELVLGDADHELHFALYADGEPEPAGTPMFEDCAHRALFGDPAFVPWRESVPTSHHLGVKAIAGGLRVELAWKDLATDPWVWDPWREGRSGEEERGRLYERIELGDERPGIPEVRVVEAFARRGMEKSPLALTAQALLERGLDGRAVLHLEAQGPRKSMDARGLPEGPETLEVVFEVRFRAPLTGK